MRGQQRLAMRLGVGEHLLLAREARVFVDVGDPRRVDLVELIAQQVDLARSRPFVASGLGQLRVDRAHLVARIAQLDQRAARRRADKRVEQRTLFDGCEQRLVRVLTVQVDEMRGRPR